MKCLTCVRIPSADSGRYMCRGCEYHLRSVLLQLVRTELRLLRAAMVPGGSRTEGSRFGGRAHAPLPANLNPLDLLGPGTPTLLEDPFGEQTGGVPLGPMMVGWAETIAREHQLVVYRRHGTEYTVPCDGAAPRTGTRTDLEAWCRWLAAYTPYVATRPWAAEMYRELDDALDRVRAITGTQPQRHHRFAPCPRCSMFGVVHTDGRWELDCEACGERIDPDVYARHAAEVLPSLTRTVVLLAAAELSPQPEPEEQPASPAGAADRLSHA